MQNLNVSDPASFPLVFDEALNKGDIDLLLKLYEPEASFRASDGSVRQGQPALRQEMKALISAKAELHNTLRCVLQSGTTALIIVDWTLELDLPHTGPMKSAGTATNVLRYTADGGWRMLIANPQGTA
jgi:ketosteroid isomerase-like protein